MRIWFWKILQFFLPGRIIKNNNETNVLDISDTANEHVSSNTTEFPNNLQTFAPINTLNPTNTHALTNKTMPNPNINPRYASNGKAYLSTPQTPKLQIANNIKHVSPAQPTTILNKSHTPSP